jgi:hypothetical protein
MREIDWPATAEFLAHLAQVFALAVGGWWTYTRFIRARSAYARVDISNSVQSELLSPEIRLLRVMVNVQNVGNVEVEPPRIHVCIHKVLPLDAAAEVASVAKDPAKPEKNWSTISEAKVDFSGEEFVTLEPGETKRFPFDFKIPSDIEVLQVYVVLPCGKGYKDDFWDEVSLHRIIALEAS